MPAKSSKQLQAAANILVWSTSDPIPPQLNAKPYSTSIPNVIIDFWMRLLSNVEFMLINYICGQIYADEKMCAPISHQQFIEGTGYRSDQVTKGVESLLLMGLLVRNHEEVDTSDPPVYSLNLDAPLPAQRSRAERTDDK